MKLLAKLENAGSSGITFFSDHKDIAEIQKEIKNLRVSGYNIIQTIAKNERHSMGRAPQLNFRLE